MTESAVTAVFNNYVYTDLNVKMDRPYVALQAMEVLWNWTPVPDEHYWEPSMLSNSRSLSWGVSNRNSESPMVANGYLRIWSRHFFDSEYTFARHELFRKRNSDELLEAGSYDVLIDKEDFDALGQEIIRAFLKNHF